MLDEKDVPYRETDNGFEAQECYVQLIRKLEKEYKAPRSVIRNKLREDIDRLLMQSRSFDELIEKIQAEGYTVKHGKYRSVRPTVYVLQTMQLYTVAFSRDALPVRRRDHTKPLAWTSW